MDNSKNGIDIQGEKLDSFANDAVNELLDQKLRNRYTHLLDKDYNADRNSKKNENSKHKYVWLILGGLVVLATMTYVLSLESKSNVTQFAYYIDQTQILGNQEILRKGPISESKLRIEANNAFIKSDFDASAKLYEQLITIGNQSSIDEFYLGASYLKLDPPKIELAIHYLIRIKKGSNLEQETNWLLSLAYLANNEQNLAYPLLNNIVKAKSYKWSEAKKILENY